jgi:hypothetical protein
MIVNNIITKLKSLLITLNLVICFCIFFTIHFFHKAIDMDLKAYAKSFAKKYGVEQVYCYFNWESCPLSLFAQLMPP